MNEILILIVLLIIAIIAGTALAREAGRRSAREFMDEIYKKIR